MDGHQQAMMVASWIWNPICHRQPTLRLLQDRSSRIWALHLAAQDGACTAKLSASIVVKYIVIIFIIRQLY